HGDDAAAVAVMVERRGRVDLVRECSAPCAVAASTVAERVAPLNHESLHDAVDFQAVVGALLGQKPEIFHCLRLLGGKELDGDWPPIRVDNRVQPAGALR